MEIADPTVRLVHIDSRSQSAKAAASVRHPKVDVAVKEAAEVVGVVTGEPDEGSDTYSVLTNTAGHVRDSIRRC